MSTNYNTVMLFIVTIYFDIGVRWLTSYSLFNQMAAFVLSNFSFVFYVHKLFLPVGHLLI
jgi:hypothetical protein